MAHSMLIELQLDNLYQKVPYSILLKDILTAKKKSEEKQAKMMIEVVVEDRKEDMKAWMMKTEAVKMKIRRTKHNNSNREEVKILVKIKKILNNPQVRCSRIRNQETKIRDSHRMKKWLSNLK